MTCHTCSSLLHVDTVTEGLRIMNDIHLSVNTSFGTDYSVVGNSTLSTTGTPCMLMILHYYFFDETHVTFALLF